VILNVRGLPGLHPWTPKEVAVPGRRGSEKRALPGQVLVRLTAEAADALDAHATAAGLTRAACALAGLAGAVAVEGLSMARSLVP
jgi:hypothetical protein